MAVSKKPEIREINYKFIKAASLVTLAVFTLVLITGALLSAISLNFFVIAIMGTVLCPVLFTLYGAFYFSKKSLRYRIMILAVLNWVTICVIMTMNFFSYDTIFNATFALEKNDDVVIEYAWTDSTGTWIVFSSDGKTLNRIIEKKNLVLTGDYQIYSPDVKKYVNKLNSNRNPEIMYIQKDGIKFRFLLIYENKSYYYYEGLAADSSGTIIPAAAVLIIANIVLCAGLFFLSLHLAKKRVYKKNRDPDSFSGKTGQR